MTVQDATAGPGPAVKCFILLQKYEEEPGFAGVWLAGLALKWRSEKMGLAFSSNDEQASHNCREVNKTVKTKQSKKAHEICIQGGKSHL